MSATLQNLPLYGRLTQMFDQNAVPRQRESLVRIYSGVLPNRHAAYTVAEATQFAISTLKPYTCRTAAAVRPELPEDAFGFQFVRQETRTWEIAGFLVHMPQTLTESEVYLIGSLKDNQTCRTLAGAEIALDGAAIVLTAGLTQIHPPRVTVQDYPFKRVSHG